MQLDQELRTLDLGDMIIAAYYQKVKTIFYQLPNIDQPVTETNLVIYMINGLGDKFYQVSDIIRHQRSLPTFLEARSMLMLEETQLQSSRTHPAHQRDHKS